MLMRIHRLKVSAEGGKGEEGLKLVHIDVYRLNNFQEILDLGWEKIIADKNNIVVVEWADKVRDLLPENTIWINFEHGKNEKVRNLQVLK